MKIIKNYENFINESKGIDDVSLFLNGLLDIPSDVILNFRDELKKSISSNESMTNEGISDIISSLKTKFKNYINDRLFNYLINRKKDWYMNLLDKLNLFDLTSFDDVVKFYPGFKLNSLYFAGGMDAAADAGMGWRGILEHEFEFGHPGSKNPELLPIKIAYNKQQIECNPSYTVDGIFLERVIEDPKKWLQLYDKPALYNPVRKEEDRTKDDTFDRMIKKWRDPETKDYEEPLHFFHKTFGGSIEPNDEHLLRIADAVFLGMDVTAGAGTYGELELLSLVRKPLFAWLVNESTNKMPIIKLWNIPHLNKVARNVDEMKVLVDTIMKFAGK